MTRSMQKFSPPLLGLLLVLMMLPFLGCDDEVSVQQFRPETGEPDFRQTGEEDTGGGGPILVDSNDCCILLPLGATKEFEVDTGARIRLGAVLYARSTGEPIPKETIAWSMVGAGEARLTALETVTGDNGVAEIEFVADEQLETYTVRADYVEAEPVEFTVTVVKLPSGDLQVNVIHASANQLEVKPFRVYLYPSSVMTCRRLNPLAPPPSELDMQVAEADGDRLRFNDLLVSGDYTVVGVGDGPNGNVVAEACAEGVTVHEKLSEDDTPEEIDLIFQLIPLNPVGTYRVRAYFNFGDAIAATGAVGSFLIDIFDGFNDPGALFYDTIFDACEYVAPGFICDLIDLAGGITGIKEVIVDTITDAVLGTEVGCTIVHAGCDVRDTVRNLELLSTLYISKLGGNFTVHGSTNFTGLALKWGDQRIEMSSEVLQNDLQLLSGDWDGSVIGYDRLLIGSHAVDLRYGELIVYIINDVILPALTDGNAHTFGEALLYWFDCEGMGISLSESLCLFGECISPETGEAMCSGTVSVLSTLMGFGEALLSLQNLPSTLQISGEVTFLENTGDFMVDYLVDGTWNGTININGESAPIDATWSGCNIGSLGPDCEYPAIDFTFGGEGACACNADCSVCE